MRKSTVMAMLLLSVSLIACDNQEAVEVAENTEITENIDSNETEVDPALETEEVSEEVEAEEVAVEEPTDTETTTTEEVAGESADATSDYTYTDLDAVKYAKQSVNVRSLPTTDGEKLGALSASQEVKVTGQCNETGWYRIEFEGNVAYASNNYLVDEKPSTTASASSSSNASGSHPEWTKGKTWTASNGVVLKVKDEYAHWDFNIATNRMAFDSSEILIIDDLDLRPGTPDFDAIVEFEYGTGAYQGGTEKMKISAADLPLVATPATKQTSAPKTDSWNAYVAQFNPLWKYQATGSYESAIPQLQNYGTGIGLISGIGDGYIFNLDWIGDCWKLTLRGYPTELQWNAIRNSIRLVSPDAETLFSAIYEQCYTGSDLFTDWDTWCTIGANQAMTSIGDSNGTYFYFK